MCAICDDRDCLPELGSDSRFEALEKAVGVENRQVSRPFLLGIIRALRAAEHVGEPIDLAYLSSDVDLGSSL